MTEELQSQFRAAQPIPVGNHDDMAQHAAFLETLILDAPVGIIRSNETGEIVYCNKRFEKIAGMTHAKLFADGWPSLVHPDDREYMWGFWSEAFDNQSPYRAETRYLRPAGDIVWVLVEASPIYGDSGDYSGHVTIITDITDRVEAAEALSLSEERYDMAISRTGLGTWELDLLNNKMTLSSACRAMLGIEDDETISTIDDFYARVHPGDVGAARRNLREHVSTGSREEVEFRLLREDGTYMWVESRSELTLDEADEPIKISGIIYDIAERKKGDLALAESQQRYDLVVRGTSVGVWDWNMTTGAFYWSPRMHEILGLDPGDGEVAYDTLYNYVHPEDATKLKAEMQRYFAAGSGNEPFSHEYRMLHADGHTIWVRSRGLAIWNDKGEPIQIAGSTDDITPRRAAEQQLRASEQRFELAVEGTSVGIWDWDFRTKDVYYSPRFREMLGLDEAHELIGFAGFMNAVHPDDLEDAMAAINRHTSLGQSYDIEFRLQHADGHYLWARARGQAVWDDQGNPVRMVGSIDDVTERKETERALAENEERLSLALHGANMGMCDMDPGTGELYCSPLMLAMFGIKDDKHAIKTHAGLMARVHDDDRDAVAEAFQVSLRNGSEFNVVCRLRREDGTYFWGNARAKPTFDDDGLPVRMTGPILDITAQKQAAEALAQSEERLELALKGSKAGLFDWDMASDEVYCSEIFLEIIGLDPANTQLRSSELLTRAHPDDREYYKKSMEEHFAGTPVFDMEYRVRHEAGHYVWVNARGQAAFDSEGNPVRMTGSVVDITARKVAEAALEEAKRVAQAANETKSEFLAMVSHEIRTPLNGVLGMAQVLADTELTGEQRDLVDIVQRSGDTLVSLINDILDLSKLEAGKLDLEDTVLDPEQTVRDVVQLAQSTASSRGVVLSYEINEDVPEAVRGDPYRVRQLVSNLIGNAVKFTEEGSVHAHISRGSGPDGDERLKISVADTGIGISEEARGRLFEKFSQADSSTTRQYGGTGLGLAISRQLVELMGGEIGVDSVEGEGSTFWFWIPLSRADEKAIAASAQSRTLTFEATRSLKILAADDNEINQILLERMLGNFGHDVDVAENGEAAVDAVVAGSYDLVLMDIHMPVLGGVEATRKIKALGGAAADIPIIACTADVIADHQAKFYEAGMVAAVSKPINLGRLIQAIDSSLDTPAHRALGGGEEACEDVPPPPSEEQAAALDSLLEGLDDIG